MENLLNTILSHVNDQSLQSISQNANTSPDQAKHALSNAIPILMNGMAKNTQDPQGAASLEQAVQKDHNGSILENLEGFFHNPDIANGPGILKHVLGERQQDAVEYISKDSGVSESSAHKILEYAAPLVMGFLGRHSMGGGMGIGTLLNSFINSQKQENPEKQGFISKLFDINHDGDIMDNLKEKGESLLGRFMK